MLKTLDQISQINQPKMHTRVYFSFESCFCLSRDGDFHTGTPKRILRWCKYSKTEFGMDQNWVWDQTLLVLLDDSSFISAFTCRCHSWDNKTVLTYF
jgi:hypothetical protein